MHTILGINILPTVYNPLVLVVYSFTLLPESISSKGKLKQEAHSY